MKTLHAVLGCLVLTRLTLNAQTSIVADSYGQSSASQAAYSAVAQDGNSCVWQRTVNETGANGKVVARTHSYTQLDAGMNHLVNGQWVPTKEEIDVLPDGTAAATNGQYQAYFPANIYDGAVSMITVDGQTLQSRPALLCYVDGTNSVILGDLQSSDGELLGSNQVIYPNAFEGLNADLRYTYKKGSFEQDVVLREQPPTPESVGLNRKTTRIEVLTEFFNAPQPSLGNGVYDQASGLEDTTLSFGNSRLILGKAFSTTNSAQKVVEGATVFKSWLEFQGRTFLVEKLPYARVATQISSLPLQSSLERKASSDLMASLTPSAVPRLPAQRSINACTNSILLAKADYNQKPGLVLDYVSLNVVVQNFTFQADTTYYMPSWGYFAIEGSAIFEGGTVIKFAPGSGNFQLINASISWLSSPYQPVILTAQDDNSVGETISGSTGTPSGYYGNGITIDSGANLVFHDVRISYLSTAFILYDNYSEFDNVQMLNCQNPILHAFAGATVNNGLFYNISGAAFTAISSSTPVTATQVTVDQCNLFADTNTSALTVMNSLVTATTNLLGGTGTLSTNQVIILASNTGIYQTVGAGSHYLANSSIYRGVGTNAVGSTVLASLATHTTYPPLIYSNQTFTISTNLPVFAKRDTNASPDLGYHYDPLDYITDNLTVTNAGLTITNGVAIACYNRAGIILQGGTSLYSVGTPIAPNWLVRYQSVQDQAILLSGTNVALGQNIVASPVGNARPTGTVQFTHFSVPSAGGFDFNLNGGAFFSNLTVEHSELWGGTNDFSGPTNSATTLLQNNLFFRSAITASNSFTAPALGFTNNLIYGTTISLVQATGAAWAFFNNDVDSCTVSTNSTIVNGYNAFINCPYNLTGTSNYISTNAINYQAGALGVFYQPTNSPLINLGNVTATQLALGHFTTQTNQAIESNSIVDIGYHYVALGTNGLPLVNSNGLPYYIADAQGGSTNQAPTITVQPANFNAILNSNAVFSVTAVGSPTLAYQWWFNATNKLAGAIGTTLSLTNVQLTNAGNYTVVITNNYGAVTSSVTVLTVLIPVVITAQPTNFTVIQGSNATFNVTATGTAPLAYQWWFNVTNLLSGATSASLTITNAQAPNAGYYSVVITNSVNSVTSSNALLTVLLFPTVSITNPVNNAGFASGANVNIGVNAVGNNATIAQVQFFQGTNNLGIITNAPYTLTWSNVPAGNYTLTAQATDSHGLVAASAGININVGSTLPAGIQYWWKAEANALDSIGTNNGTLQGGVTYTNGEVGQAFSFDGSSGYVSTSIQISNPQNFTIEGWFKTTTTSGGILVGFADTQTGTTASHDRLIYMDNTGKIYFGVYESTYVVLNNATSYNDGYWHHVAATISTNSGSVLYLDGAVAAVNTNATTAQNFAGWWRISEVNLGAWPNVPSSFYFNGDIDELSIYGRPLGSNEIAAIYNAGTAGKGSSSVPIITTQPVNQTAFQGSNVVLSVVAAGASPLTYQWYTTNSGTLFGATNAALLFNAVQAFDAGLYYVVVANAYGTVTSSNAYLTVLSPPSISLQPTNQTAMAGSNVTFSVIASGTAPLAYQWYRTSSGILANATNSTLTLTNIQLINADNYFAIVTNLYGLASSTNATLTVLSPPVITTQPANQLVVAGGNAAFSVTAVGAAPLNYQWYGVHAGALTGATNAVLSLTAVQTNNADSYYILITNYVGSATSVLATLSVVTAPTVIITNPLNHAAFFAGSTNIALAATAVDTGGTISQVQFFQGTTSLGIITNSPFSLVWSNVIAGSYALTAVAVDDGLMATSAVVNISIFSTNDVLVWLKADSITGLVNNAVVTSWPDKSAWNNNATQDSGETQPTFVTNILNGYPTVRCSGVPNALKLSKYTATNNFTTIVVARATQPEALYAEDSSTDNNEANIDKKEYFALGGDYDLHYIGDFQGAEVSLALGTNGISIFEYAIDGGGQGAAPLAVYAANIGAGFSIIGLNCSNQLPSIYYDGSKVVTGIHSQSSRSQLGLSIGCGGASNSGGQAMNGDLSEILIFNRPLSDLEHLAVDTYLNNKYTIIPAAPPAPTNVFATAVSSNQVVVSWLENATNFVSGYYIERKQGVGGTYQQIAAVNSALAYVDTNLFSGFTYYYRLRAYNLAGVSSYSIEASATTVAGSSVVPFGDLKFWVRADLMSNPVTNMPVAVWSDQSGNGYDAVQSTTTNQPYWVPGAIGGLPVVRFNGTNSFFNLTNMLPFISVATQAEVFVVLRAATNAISPNPLWELGGYYFTPQSYMPVSNAISDDFCTYNNDFSYSFTSPYQPLDQYHVYNVSSQTNNWNAWINGTLIFQSTNNDASFEGVPTSYMPMLGAHFAYLGSMNCFAGDMAEVLIFDRGLTVAERSSVNNYLAVKYAAALGVTPTPENLSAIAISSTQIGLNWSEPLSGGATQVSVERSTNTTGGFLVVTQLSALQFFDTNLLAGTTYYYRVRGINQTYTTSNSAYSSTVQATTFTNGPTLPLPLALWLRADTGVSTNSAGQVSAWNDQSGNGNNAIQSTISSQPSWTTNANGNAVISFNGTNSSLNLPSFLNGAAGAEAFVVLKATTNYPAIAQSLWEMGGNTFFSKTYPGTDGSLNDDFGSSTVQAESQGAPVQSLSQYHVYEVMSASNGWASWLNGSPLYQKSGNTVSFGAPLTLGVSPYEAYAVGYYSANSYFAGNIAEVIVFSRSLAANERATVNEYLNSKYSLVPAVPATPTNLLATAISPTQIALTWDETLNGAATQIGIQRCLTSNGLYQVVAQIPGATSYIDTNLSPGTTYFYQVSAINLSQWSPTSNVAQATTPIIGTNLPLNSLALWLKSDAGLLQGSSNQLVNQWADQSGNGNNGTQFASANSPAWVPGVIGDRPVVRFNGTSSFLNLPSFMNSATGAEAFVVLKVATNYPATAQSLWEMGGDGWNGKTYPNTDGSINDDFGSFGGYANVGVHALGIPAQPINQYHIYQVSSQPNNWSAWINGIPQFQTSANTVSFAVQPELGVSFSQAYSAGWYTASAYFAGDVAEILVFNRGLTPAERATVSTYLNGKFALVPRMPATPSNLVATALSPTQVSLNWQETLNAGATRVSIERLNTNTWTYQVVTQVSDANSYIDTNLTAGTTCYYRVRAINVDQWSAYSGIAQATTPAAGSPLPVGSLALWLKADAGLWLNSSNAPVSFWTDQSGNNNSAAQTILANEPVWVAGTNGGYPNIQFNGTNSTFNLQGFLNNAGSAEAFVVLKTATTNTFQTLWEFGGDSWDEKTYPYTDGSISDDFGSTTVQSLGVPTQPLNQYHVYQVSSQKDDWAAWINGQLQYETAESAFNTVSFAAGMTLGGAPYEVDDGSEDFPSFNYFEGNIAEVLVFNRSLTTTERSAVNTYLNGKYNLAPVITITNPVNNALFLRSTNISIAASAADSAGIAQVQFFQGTTSLGIVTNSPYSLVWSNVPFGSYALTACATDNNGLNFTSAIVNITVAGIAITAPTNNALMVSPTNIAFTASVVDGNGISQVQYFQGTTLLGASSSVPYSFTWNSVTSGAYALTARATDNNGLILTSSVVNVTVDVPPAVTLTNPVNNARFVAGTNINLGAKASDSDGTVAQVQFFQGTNLLKTVTTAPYSMVWSNVPAGAYSLTAAARDNSGLVSNSVPVNIQVVGVVITSPTNNLVTTSPASISLSAAVTDNTNITQVQYFQGATSLGILTTAPYNLAWTNVATGNYSLKATATDAGGLVFTSPLVTVLVDTNPVTTDRDGDGVNDYTEYLEGRNPLINGSVPDTNGVVNLQIYTPLR